MTFPNTLSAGLFTLTFAATAWAGEATIHIEDAFARTASPSAKAGAAFMVLVNPTDQDDRLISARSDVSARVELHTHIHGTDGVMQMVELDEGIAIPAGGSHALKRGGDHVMFMGLTRALEQDDTVVVTLTFEKAGSVRVEIPVDLTR